VSFTLTLLGERMGEAAARGVPLGTVVQFFCIAGKTHAELSSDKEQLERALELVAELRGRIASNTERLQIELSATAGALHRAILIADEAKAADIVSLRVVREQA